MTTQTAQSTQELLDDRYGRRSSTRRRIVGWSVVAVVAVGATLALGWSTVVQALDDVDVTDTGFAVVDEHSVTVSFQVTTPPGAAVVCALEAQDPEHGVVGWRVVEYPESPEHQRAFTESIPTLALATTGFVNSCWTP
jgi:hypothetical protein